MTMTLNSDLGALWCALHDLRDALVPLRLLAVEDRPESVVPQPVQSFSDAVDDVFGHLQSAIEALSPAIGYASARDDHVATALARCHRAMLDFAREWAEDVSTYRRLRQLHNAAAERGPAWRSWATSAIDGVHGCQNPCHQVQLALLTCWQCLAELAGAGDKSPCRSAAAKER